ncbi:hypothetical protein QJS10_CPB17g01348 [Acorus calamus]|uniref:Threonyl/alanyl tRNA synthetase SAD domain-containing protein n=1 Tax=Acorus calamus TaxID=4465 RepID=A0AAV9CXD4_ACOCL|nr:hypothetical protein QJS10_CPB17g01348 [Acorus calamus]
MDLGQTKLDYFEDMWKLESKSTLLSHIKSNEGGGRQALVLESTIFHPQGGGQPSDTGFIIDRRSGLKFVVADVRLKDGLVLEKKLMASLREGVRLHSAGHLLDTCMRNVGLDHLEPGKGYHFPDGPFVEYKGTFPQDQLQTKQKELEAEVNKLISIGGKVSASVLAYDEAAELCGGSLPEYISKSSKPRIVKLGNNPGCPCGGTHVANISDIRALKVSQIRMKKGFTKIFYNIGS